MRVDQKVQNIKILCMLECLL